MRIPLLVAWLCYILCSSSDGYSQILLKGRITDEGMNTIAGVHLSSTRKSAVSDDQGKFQMELNKGEVLQISHINYETQFLTFSTSQDVEIIMKSRMTLLDELEIQSSTSPDVDVVNLEKVSTLTPLFGESDILKYIVTLPGVSNINSLDAGFSVRGGSTTENAFLINGLRIADPKHISTLVTAFEPYILNTSEVYKSGFPSIYNHKLSGYVDMSGNTSVDKGITGEVSLGVISSAAKISWVFGKQNNHNLKLSARRSYLHLVSWGYEQTNLPEQIPKYNLSDFTVSYHGSLNDKWSLEAFGLRSEDDVPLELSEGNLNSMAWGSRSGIVDLKRKMKKNGTLSISAGANSGHSSFENVNANQHITSEDLNYTMMVHAQQPLSNKLALDAGYRYENNEYHLEEEGSGKSRLNNQLHSLFIDALWFPLELLTITAGANLTHFNGQSTLTDLSPRLKIETNRSKYDVWLDYARTQQYEEKLPFFTIRSPVDIAVPLAQNNQAAISDQISLGTSSKALNHLEGFVSIFYKYLTHIKDFSAGSRSNLDFESIEMIEGEGTAYGVEAELIYNHRKIGARVNYTYLNSKRRFDQINGGNSFSPPFDITSSATASLTYAVNKRWVFSAFWIYSSGIYVTIPEGITVAKDITNPSSIVNYIPIYRNRYNYRLPARHRLDLSISYTTQSIHALKVSCGVFNAYNRKNADFVFFDVEQTDDFFVSFIPKSKLVLPLVPHVTLTFLLNQNPKRHE